MSPLLFLLCTSCACVFHFPPICFPQNCHMCIQGHWNWQPGVFFRLAVGLISAAYLGLGQTYTHTHTHRHVYTQTHMCPQETAGCVGYMRRHLEEAKRMKERCLSLLLCSMRHASAAPHNSSLCSALLRLHQNLPQTQFTRGNICFHCLNDIVCSSFGQF